MAKLTVHVYDVQTNVGIPGLSVYLFEDGGGIESPAKATHTGVTDGEGKAVFEDVYGFYRVGVSNGRYANADPNQAVPAEWKSIYSAWGACGVTGDIQYQFPLTPLEKPPTPPAIDLYPLIGGLTPIFFSLTVIGATELSKIKI